MGCGNICANNQKISEATKKIDKILHSRQLEEDERNYCEKDIEKEGHLISNRKGKPALVNEQKTKHWLFEVEEIKANGTEVMKPWHGVYKVPDGYLPKAKKDIDIDLKIEYVYGYNCVESRNNAFFCKNPEFILFPAGIFGVVLEINNNIQKIYKEHEDEIVALAYHKISDIVATADKRYKIAIWNCSSLITLKTHKTSEKGTLSLAFNPKGDNLISLSASFNISIYKWQTFTCTASFNFYQNIIFSLICSNEEFNVIILGEKYIGFLTTSNTIENGVFAAKGKICSMLCSAWHKKKCYTGGTNGQIYIWSPPQLETSWQVFDQKVPIHAIKILKQNIICSATDQTLVILNMRMERKRSLNLEGYSKSIDISGDAILVGLSSGIIGIVNEKFNEIIRGYNCEVTGICICSKSVIFASGYCEVNIFDYVKHIQIGKISETMIKLLANKPDIDLKIQSLDFIPNKNHLAIGTSIGIIEIYHFFTIPRGIKGVQINSESIFALKYSTNEAYLCCGCESYIKILETESYSIVQSCFTNNIVRSIDWDIDNSMIQATTSLNEITYLAVDGSNINGSLKFYATWTSRIGWPLAVFCNDLAELSHVVSVSSSFNLDYIGLGDDWGYIHLTLFPGTRPTRKIRANESRVDKILWTNSDEELFSIGNRCIIQWKIVKINESL